MCSFPCMDFLNDLGENRYMKRIKLTVAYDGTAYCGWQVQPNGVTIEEILNREISGLTGEEIRVCMRLAMWRYLTQNVRFPLSGLLML